MMNVLKTTSLALLCACFLNCAVANANSSDWVSLFDGKSLKGWKANERPDSWAIEDGAIVTRGDRSHLFYVGEVANAKFKNFEFKAEVMTEPGSNSGIYVHTKFQDEGWPAAGYELQVINSNPQGPSKYVEHKMTGSVYAVRNTWSAPAKDGEWFEYRIRVVGKTIQTYIDGRLICEYTEPEKPWRPDDKKQRLLGSGTFAFQAHDPDSVTHYRKIQVKLLPDDMPAIAQPLEDLELDRLITQLSNSNHPLIDIGVSAPNLSYASEQAYAARKYGVTIVETDLGDAPESLLVVTDRDASPSVAALKAAKESGAKIAFSSGGATKLEPERLKARLEAIKEADLGWADIWVPGK